MTEDVEKQTDTLQPNSDPVPVPPAKTTKSSPFDAADIENLLNAIDESLDELRDKVDDNPASDQPVKAESAPPEVSDPPTPQETTEPALDGDLDTDTGDIDNVLADLAEELMAEKAGPAPPASQKPKTESVLPVVVDQEVVSETEDEIDTLLADLENSVNDPQSGPVVSDSASVSPTTDTAVSPTPPPAEVSDKTPASSDDIDSLLADLTGEMDKLNQKPPADKAPPAQAQSQPIDQPKPAETETIADTVVEAEPETPTGEDAPPQAEPPPTEEDQILEEELAPTASAMESANLDSQNPGTEQLLPLPMPARMLVYSMTTINKPFSFLPDPLRDTLGIVAVSTCIICLVLMAILIFGL